MDRKEGADCQTRVRTEFWNRPAPLVTGFVARVPSKCQDVSSRTEARPEETSRGLV